MLSWIESVRGFAYACLVDDILITPPREAMIIQVLFWGSILIPSSGSGFRRIAASAQKILCKRWPPTT